MTPSGIGPGNDQLSHILCCNATFNCAVHNIVIDKEKIIPCQRLMPTEAHEPLAAALSYGPSAPK